MFAYLCAAMQIISFSYCCVRLYLETTKTTSVCFPGNVVREKKKKKQHQCHLICLVCAAMFGSSLFTCSFSYLLMLAWLNWTVATILTSGAEMLLSVGLDRSKWNALKHLDN